MTAITTTNSSGFLLAAPAIAGRLMRPLVGMASRITLAVAALRLVRAPHQSRPAQVIEAPSLPAASQKQAEPARLSAAIQWARLSDVVSTAIAGAKSAADLQSSATQQLDLAQYGLTTLMDELSAVMSVPGRRERAQVYRLEPVAAQPENQALAA